ncbi:MAG TPA: DNA alkylation repair protein [Atribacterota bacterium]|nr:DNA alkylation repair protein [Atribacterota bacterium]
MENSRIREIKEEFKKFSNQQRAKILQRYFKTGKGEYGEGDIFLGLRVPDTRKIAKKYDNLSLEEVTGFLISQIHEERLFALLLLINLFQRGEEEDRKQVYDLYLKNTEYINNWDLVDISAGSIAGAYLYNRDKTPLYKLAKSEDLWERRIAIMATSFFIKMNELEDTIRIAEMLLKDKEDLIHKAAGWMLREIGKRDMAREENYLKRYYQEMPRTMLRYALEKFPEEKQKSYLKKRKNDKS